MDHFQESVDYRVDRTNFDVVAFQIEKVLDIVCFTLEGTSKIYQKNTHSFVCRNS